MRSRHQAWTSDSTHAAVDKPSLTLCGKFPAACILYTWLVVMPVVFLTSGRRMNRTLPFSVIASSLSGFAGKDRFNPTVDHTRVPSNRMRTYGHWGWE